MKCNFKDNKGRCLLKTKDSVIGSVSGKCDGTENCIVYLSHLSKKD